jgi:hypothetical protein
VDRYIVKKTFVGWHVDDDEYTIIDTTDEEDVCYLHKPDIADRICRLLNADAKEGSDE